MRFAFQELLRLLFHVGLVCAVVGVAVFAQALVSSVCTRESEDCPRLVLCAFVDAATHILQLHNAFAVEQCIVFWIGIIICFCWWNQSRPFFLLCVIILLGSAVAVSPTYHCSNFADISTQVDEGVSMALVVHDEPLVLHPVPETQGVEVRANETIVDGQVQANTTVIVAVAENTTMSWWWWWNPSGYNEIKQF